LKSVATLAPRHGPSYGGEGIRVNCNAPSMAYTPVVYSRGTNPEMREALGQG